MPRPSRNLDRALLAAGRSLFPDRGCAALSVREVADAAGVSVCEISRIGTRMSGREPSTYTLRERGSGFTAATSTCAVAARNLGLAFMCGSFERAEGARMEVPLTLPTPA